MGRINVRVDEDLLDEVDSQGDVRSEVVRNALKQYLGKEDVRHEAEELTEVVEQVVDRKVEQDIYPRLGNIYDKLDDELDAEDERTTVDIQATVDTDIYDFYDGYTRAFETTLGEVVADLLDEHAHDKSDELRAVSPNEPSWLLPEEDEE